MNNLNPHGTCEHGNQFPGYYVHPTEDIMVVCCTKCYETDHPLELPFTKPRITKYGQKLLAMGIGEMNAETPSRETKTEGGLTLEL